VSACATVIDAAAQPGAVPEATPPVRVWSPEEAGPIVPLRIGAYEFRIPRAYFGHPPSASGVDDGFYIRVLWPGFEPETEATRHVFGRALATEDGQRRLQILMEVAKPGFEVPTAPWMLRNQLRGEQGPDVSVDDFRDATAETFGLRYLPANRHPAPRRGEADFFIGRLAGDRFVGLRCDTPNTRANGFRFCRMFFDWRPGVWVRMTFFITYLSEWRRIGDGVVSLIDQLRIGDPGTPAQ